MKAYQSGSWGHAPVLADVPAPEPGPGQVLVRVGGTDVCRGDVDVTPHWNPDLLPWPWTLPFTSARKENATECRLRPPADRLGEGKMSTRASIRHAAVSALAVGLLSLLGVPQAQAAHLPTDVSVTKTASSAGPVAGGDNITYTITVTNSNPLSFTGQITLTDVVPSGTTFVSVTGTFPFADEFLHPGQPCTTPPQGGTGTVTCTGVLDQAGSAADEATFTLVVKVDANAQGPITNTATAALANDPDLSNNVGTVVTNVGPTHEERPGMGCGDKNHVHEREAECKNPAK